MSPASRIIHELFVVDKYYVWNGVVGEGDVLPTSDPSPESLLFPEKRGEVGTLGRRSRCQGWNLSLGNSGPFRRIVPGVSSRSYE